MNTKRTDFSCYPLQPLNINVHWLLGFVEGDGGFSLSTLSFFVTQHVNSLILLEAIREFLISQATLLGVNLAVSININRLNVATLTITRLSSLTDFILPLFFALRSCFVTKKLLDFDIWHILILIHRFGSGLSPLVKFLISRLSSYSTRFNSSTSLVKSFQPVTQVEINDLFKLPIKNDLTLDHVTNMEKLSLKLGLLKGVKVHIYDITGKELPESPFSSKAAAARFLDIPLSTLKRYINSGKFFKNKYSFKEFID